VIAGAGGVGRGRRRCEGRGHVVPLVGHVGQPCASAVGKHGRFGEDSLGREQIEVACRQPGLGIATADRPPRSTSATDGGIADDGGDAIAGPGQAGIAFGPFATQPRRSASMTSPRLRSAASRSARARRAAWEAQFDLGIMGREPRRGGIPGGGKFHRLPFGLVEGRLGIGDRGMGQLLFAACAGELLLRQAATCSTACWRRAEA